MTEAHNQFGRVASMQANAVGEPGSRRFRLLVTSSGGATATLWMEKEQLFNLAVALKNLTVQVEEQKGGGQTPGEDGEPEVLSSIVSQPLEFQVGRLAVGYDEATSLYLIAANDIEASEEATPELSLMATKQDIEALADEAFEVCAAGRPRCPLCSAPMNAGEKHICPRQNGHSYLGETQELE